MAITIQSWMGLHAIKCLAIFGLLSLLWSTFRVANRGHLPTVPLARPAFSSEPPNAVITPSRPSSSYPDGIHPDSINDTDARQRFCSNYHLPPHRYEQNASPRKIYDVLLVGTELEMLEIRLGTMAPHVDYFVIVEAAQTLHSPPAAKALHVQEHWERFKPWHSQLIHHTLNLEGPAFNGLQAWAREQLARDATFRALLSLNKTQARNLGDILLSGDVDELWRPSALRMMRNCDVPERVTARSVGYSYSFQWRETGRSAEWLHPQATTYKGDDTLLPTDLRHGTSEYVVREGGWHCSWCFGTLQEMVAKLTSYSQRETAAKAEFRNLQKMVARVREGIDIFDRGQLDRIDNNTDIPSFVLENKHLYGYMLDRDGPNAGFRDCPLGESDGNGL